MSRARMITWEEVQGRKNLIGGDIEVIEDGTKYRGPIEKIEIVGNNVRITSPWCARFNLETKKWEAWKDTFCLIKLWHEPRVIGRGKIFVEDYINPIPSQCTLFPKGGSKLNPSKVQGLKKR